MRVAALTAALACGCAPPPSGSLTVVSLGGSYGQALVKGYLEPFTAETGVEIRLDDYNGGLAQVRAQVETGNVHWDVVDFETADAVSGCDEGLLEPIDPALLAPGPDGVPAEDDFLPGTLLECSVGTLFYSTIYAYNAERLTGGKPATLEDFFDLERFPGRRGLRRVPFANLEFALIADGVPLDEVYATLDTPAGIDRAFRKLDTIKDQVVWYDAGAQPPQMLADGEVVMSTAFNGRIFNAQNLENQPFVIVWGRPVAGRLPARHRRGHPRHRGGAGPREVRLDRGVDGRGQPPHRLQPHPPFRCAARLDARRDRRRHGSAHARLPGEHRTRPAERLGLVERQQGRHERALQRVAGAVTRPARRAAALTLPLVAFTGVTFVIPLATMLVRSVHDPVVADALPDTLDRLRGWDGQSDPGEAAYAAAARASCCAHGKNGPSAAWRAG